jgi:spermidine synthase
VRRLSIAISLMAVSTLMIELSLIRVFDILFYPNLAYMIITCAIFAFGLAGIYSVLRPLKDPEAVQSFLSSRALLFSIATLAILPVTNLLPFDFYELKAHFLTQFVYFLGIYLVLVLPFFLAGLVFTNLFATYAKSIQTLYFWDLAGAAIGSVILIPFLPTIGPGGILLCGAALGLFASALFSQQKVWSALAVLFGLAIIIIPFARSEGYYDFKEHQNKGGVKTARESGMIEYTIWDPISKIDVMYDSENHGWFRYIAYDGGTQTSTFYDFDGDFQYLRDHIAEEIGTQFWQRGVLASHYIKRDTNQKVLVIGSAGGQEIKAALMYGASHVDGVELVGAVVELGKTQYSQYIGDLFHNPKVNVQVGEGRSYLRASREKYGIIQIFSNHTSSSIGSGTGAMSTTYLQTADAYEEYFEHLTENGILHINHHYYPKMITTAALAWTRMGRTNFQQHVVVFEREGEDTLPTFLIKMQPWTVEEMNQLKEFFFADWPGDPNVYRLVEDPLHPENSFLSSEFYSGQLSPQLSQQVDFRIEPSTDNKPYFNFLRKNFSPVEISPTHFMSESMVGPLNSYLSLNSMSIPLDVAPLIIIGTISLLLAGAFILLPLQFSEVGKSKWPGKSVSLLYFSCLGAGFIIIEFVFIQIFMKLIGSPLYTSSIVIFMLLFSAGIGSFATSKLNITPANRWQLPFLGILAMVLLLLLIYPFVFNFFLASPLFIRILVACGLIFPLGFFLGMPFPLGILSLEHLPKGAVAWAWGMNGLFTVIGGLASVVLSITWGFQVTLLIAAFQYVVSLLAFARIRSIPLYQPRVEHVSPIGKQTANLIDKI